MFSSNRLAKLLSCFAITGLLTSPLGAAQSEVEDAPKPPRVLDVSLRQGRLVGQFVNANGQAMSQQPFRITAIDQSVSLSSLTDKEGRFDVRLKDAGVYAITSADQSLLVRAWNPKLAPPTTKPGVLCVVDDDVQRGQSGFMARVGNRLTPVLTKPIYIGAIAATAIAIPVALDAADDDEDGS
jgi:hypothetical protein